MPLQLLTADVAPLPLLTADAATPVAVMVAEVADFSAAEWVADPMIAADANRLRLQLPLADAAIADAVAKKAVAVRFETWSHVCVACFQDADPTTIVALLRTIADVVATRQLPGFLNQEANLV